MKKDEEGLVCVESTALKVMALSKAKHLPTCQHLLWPARALTSQALKCCGTT